MPLVPLPEPILTPEERAGPARVEFAFPGRAPLEPEPEPEPEAPPLVQAEPAPIAPSEPERTSSPPEPAEVVHRDVKPENVLAPPAIEEPEQKEETVPTETKTCAIKGCGREGALVARGLCKLCYARASRAVLRKETTWEAIAETHALPELKGPGGRPKNGASAPKPKKARAVPPSNGVTFVSAPAATGTDHPAIAALVTCTLAIEPLAPELRRATLAFLNAQFGGSS